MLRVLSTKRLVAAAKCLVAATKNLFVVPNFVAVRKPIFFVRVSEKKTFHLRSFTTSVLNLCIFTKQGLKKHFRSIDKGGEGKSLFDRRRTSVVLLLPVP